jgi:membrane protein implicated in regulation of membrane protease activity
MILSRLRDPQTFLDIIGVIAFSVGVIAVIMFFTDSPLVRLEVFLFFAIVIIWVLWAIAHLLEQSRLW